MLSRTTLAMFAAFLTFWLIAAPSAGDLLIDMHARKAYVKRWAPAFVRISFHPPLKPMEDPKRRLVLKTLGAVVRGKAGKPEVVAAAQRLRGVKLVTLRFADGKEVPARVERPQNWQQVPVVRLVPDKKDALKGRLALVWAERKALLKGLKAWAIEWPNMTGPTGMVFQPNLIQTEIGVKVEWPLDRFFYVRMKEADGMPLLRHDGKLLCLVFRQVPGVEGSSLCTPQDAAFRAQPKSKP